MQGVAFEEENQVRYILILAVLAATVLGCARDVGIPTLPDTHDPSGALQSQSPYDGPYRLWGEWLFYIDESHEKIDVVPARNGRVHLNALKFLESYCEDCLKITGIENNGDGTVNVTVQITHPFTGLPQFTGFDVKGIIMFEGSHDLGHSSTHWPLYPENFSCSSRLLGDPELLNPDGYTYRWSPWYESGSSMPIFNYWPGKYSNGTPTANINGYMNYYSNETRHMFECNAEVSRTYHISLPPGPLVVGYAVEACWEPPLVTPVINPADDFPVTANQPEAYHFKVVINDGEPVTSGNCCNEDEPDTFSVYEARVELDLWYMPFPPDVLFNDQFQLLERSTEIDWNGEGYSSISWTPFCDGPENWYCIDGGTFYANPAGIYKCLAIEYHVDPGGPGIPKKYPAFDIYEVVIEK